MKISCQASLMRIILLKMLHVENEIGEGFEYTGCDFSNLHVKVRN